MPRLPGSSKGLSGTVRAAGVSGGTGTGFAGEPLDPPIVDSSGGSGGGMGLGLSSTRFGTAGTRLGTAAAGGTSGRGVWGIRAAGPVDALGAATAAAGGRCFNGPLSWLMSASRPVTTAMATSHGTKLLFLGACSAVASCRGFRAGGSFTAGIASATVGAFKPPPRLSGFHPRVAAHARPGSR